MDLYAYCQIDILEEVAKANNISVPRLRGYRLMSEEKPLTKEKIKEIADSHDMTICERCCCSIPSFNLDTGWSEFSRKTDKIKRKYLICKEIVEETQDGKEYSYEEVIGFRWDLLHGKKRKNLKFALKKSRKKVLEQFTAHNKYAGRDDVLYIHARIGGGNWEYYGGEDLKKQPWFLEKVDDYWDDTYCDIYAKIDPATIPKQEG